MSVAPVSTRSVVQVHGDCHGLVVGVRYAAIGRAYSFDGSPFDVA